MDQRTSSLQQRLEARRNMFFNKPDPASATAASNLSYAASRIGSTSSATSSSNSSISSSTATPISSLGSSMGRSVKDTLTNLTNQANHSYKSNGEEATSPRKYSNSSISTDSSTAKPAVPVKPPVPAARISSSITAPKVAEPVEKSEVTKKVRQLDGYVGFANLPNQVYRKAVKRGFEFTLMVVGESGLGKSTLINSMFLTDVYSVDNPGPSARIKKTVQVETSKVVLTESGVNLTLTIVDTPGFGDAVDNSNCWEPVIKYVESRYEAFLDAETRVNRVPLPDSRVHACLFFIAPSGHGLKPLDVEFMRRLHDKVNIIPIIAKADTLIPEEIADFKQRIMNQITQAKIKIYQFPDEVMEPSESKTSGRKDGLHLRDRVPFAVVGSNMLIESLNGDGKKTRGRRYPWGVVDIENLEHCDFVPLRDMLIRSHLQDLKEVTNNVLYENFRCRKLAGVAGTSMDKIPNKNPLATIEEERREHQAKMAKMEKEMEEVFERKVREKKQKLADSEADLERRHKESKEKLEQQIRELEAQRAAFEQEKAAWESINGITISDLKQMSLESLDGKKKKGGALSGVSFRMGK